MPQFKKLIIREAIEIDKTGTINKRDAQNLPTVRKILQNKQWKAQDTSIPINTEETNNTVSNHEDRITNTQNSEQSVQAGDTATPRYDMQ